ncbi:MAG: AtpZ/AtpI family protein [Dehalogenimonas sp.]|uniref:AtpZ/AtpI family protein n=1 Tax=Candidatus Dehalogenimonas loeffleri TaxID=3127115 RepID=A0ABZ2J7F6_9CHLR|nr:AtpZ/AtpI family protein [Dehalogenimonas sp.]
MNRWLIALKFIGVGWFISFAILGGVLLGRWVDQRLNSEPLVLIIGLFLGLIVAFYGAYQLISGSSKNKN